MQTIEICLTPNLIACPEVIKKHMQSFVRSILITFHINVSAYIHTFTKISCRVCIVCRNLCYSTKKLIEWLNRTESNWSNRCKSSKFIILEWQYKSAFLSMRCPTNVNIDFNCSTILSVIIIMKNQHKPYLGCKFNCSTSSSVLKFNVHIIYLHSFINVNMSDIVYCNNVTYKLL